MQGAPDHVDQPVDRAEFRRPAGQAGVELYRARIVHHQFAPHVHDGYGLGVVEAGGGRIQHHGREHLPVAGALLLMRPGELHTGAPATPQGWRYRMLYLDEAVLAAQWGEHRPWRFDEAVRQDPTRAAALAGVLRQLWQRNDDADALGVDSALADALGLLAPLARGGPPPTAAPPRPSEAGFARVVDCLHADLPREWSLAELAGLAGLSPFHFQRAFKARFQISPHQWRMALRVAEAKRQLARGESVAEVAAAVGMTDQAHLTRRFAGMYGVTPGRYQRQLGWPSREGVTR